MYAAMASAPLGDDVLGDDPTVDELETETAALLGKESGLFVPSGTMGNQIAIACQTSPGDAILIEEEAHILFYEVGGTAMHSGVVSWTLASDDGFPEPKEFERRVLKADLHRPGTRLICLENSHNRKGGTVATPDRLAAYRDVADRHEIGLHLDGARLWNAAVSLDVAPAALAKPFDTVSVCLSKGLASPVGSVLVGPAETIEKARIWRKRMGGGMRQSGILAACGLVSIRRMVHRLKDDHRRARRVAEAVADLPGVCVDLDRVQTNLVLIHTAEPSERWVALLQNEGVRCLPTASNTLRLVFHCDVVEEDVEPVIQAFRGVSDSLSH